jgi:hypothetical protein
MRDVRGSLRKTVVNTRLSGLAFLAMVVVGMELTTYFSGMSPTSATYVCPAAGAAPQ